MYIAIPLYDRFAALDAVGPYEALGRLHGARVRWVGAEKRPYRADLGVQITADTTFDALPAPDIVLVPGGDGTLDVLDDPALLGWIARAHETSTWTTSVCTGSLLLGAAGVLEGLRATTHWAYLERLAPYAGEVVGDERVVEQGKVMTAAGVSSGIDMALTLIDRQYGPELSQAIQLGIEYDPAPPHDAGSTAKAPPEIVDVVRSTIGVPQA
ncbi:MAG TPA: DJ-1/PfpI family protein [Capillimicrobium sp.]|nr:DJ-1/PfpI family protein [Capillimicrobium sp.]